MVLQDIIMKGSFTEEARYLFSWHLQSALLLALRAQGMLTPMQYRHAEEALKLRRLDRAKHLRETGDLL